MYQYDYTVTNGTADDLFDLDISVTPGIVISGLTAPMGLVSFLENTASFGPTPATGFIFDSSFPPAGTTFTANLQDPATFDILTSSGTTQGPVVTPEPSSLTLCALGGAALLWRRRWYAPASLSVPSTNPRSLNK
jgi:hypothetical protein